MSSGDFANFAALNLAMLINAFLIVRWINRDQVLSAAKLILSLFIVFCSQIIITEILLGTMNMLSYKNLSIMTYSFLLILIFSQGKNIFKKMHIKTERDYPNPFGMLILFGPVVLLLFAKAFNAALQIPLEYDSVAYHLPFVTEWLKTGTLNNLYYSAFAGPLSYYPSNYELLDLWTFLAFKNDFFANLINFPLFAILGITTWSTLRNLKIGKNIALVTTAIPFYMPIFLHQAGLPLVDLFFVLTFAIAIYFIQEISTPGKEKTNTGDFLLFGLCMGLFIGTKYLGLVYGVPLIFLLGTLSLLHAKGKRKRLAKLGLLTLLGILLTGSFFYIRNWIDSGNPLFPVEINLMGKTLFEGYPGINENLESTSLLENLHSRDGIKKFAKTFFSITGPFGIIFIAVPLLIFAFTRSAMTPITLAAGIALYFYLYIKAPYTNKDLPQNIRYAMPFLFLGTFGLAHIIAGIKKIPKYSFYFLTGITLALSMAFLIINPPEFIAYGDRILIDYSTLWKYKKYVFMAFAATIGLAYSCWAVFATFKSPQFKATAVALSLVFSLGVGVPFLKFAYTERESLTQYWSEIWFKNDPSIIDLMQASEWLNRNAPKAAIAYTGFNFHYHLYGRNFEREVDYVNINECTRCRYVDFKNSSNSIRRDPNDQHWLTNLKTLKKEYLVMSPSITKTVYSHEFEWANQNPTHFKRVFNTNNVYIYQIIYE